MKKFLFAAMIVAALSCGVAGDEAKPVDQIKIQGVWLAQTESQNGMVKKVNYTYVFKGDKLSFTDETGKEMKYLFHLDTNNNPRLITIRPEDTLTKSEPVRVAYALAGDSLTIVVASQGLLPTAISDKNNQELIVCKRKDTIQ